MTRGQDGQSLNNVRKRDLVEEGGGGVQRDLAIFVRPKKLQI